MTTTSMAGYSERIADWHKQLRDLVSQGSQLRDAWGPAGYETLNVANAANPEPVPGSEWVTGEWNVIMNALIDLVDEFYEEHRNAIAMAAEKA